MPVTIKDFDEIYNPDGGGEERFPGQGEDNLGGPPTGGSGNTGGSGSGTSTRSDSYYFSIKSNQTDWTLYINDSVRSGQKTVRVLREKLAEENTKIQIKKQGFSSNTYYVVEMVDDGVPIIKNQRAGDTPLGINTKDIVLTKYVDGEPSGLPEIITDTTSNELNFTLRKNSGGGDEYEEPDSYSIRINVSGKGSPVSVLKNGNKAAEFFPEIGNNTYEDTEGTFYKIRSSDLSLYKIVSITITTPDNSAKELKANEGESLDIDLTLNKNYTIDIVTEEIFQGGGGLDPQISLVKTDPRKYNINKKTGVPIMIRKNEDVQAITIIVGDDVLEFDNLDDGDIIGLTIPHDVFKQIGKYNIKLYPFSFDDYENQIRPDDAPEVVKPKEVKPKFEVKEEPLPELPKPKDIFNLYKPNPKTFRGGGAFLFGDNFGIPNPFEPSEVVSNRNYMERFR